MNPSRIFEELLIDKTRTGMITGNPSTAIIIDRFEVLKEIAEIIVNADESPRHPKRRFSVNRGVLEIGFPNRMIKTRSERKTRIRRYTKE